MKYLPRSGPIRLDCRTLDGAAAVLRVRILVGKIRRGARRMVVQIDSPAVLDAVGRWARGVLAPHEVAMTDSGWTMTMYLMPAEFGAPPMQSVRLRAARQRPMGSPFRTGAPVPTNPVEHVAA